MPNCARPPRTDCAAMASGSLGLRLWVGNELARCVMDCDFRILFRLAELCGEMRRLNNGPVRNFFALSLRCYGRENRHLKSKTVNDGDVVGAAV